jgi:hypothetical protein
MEQPNLNYINSLSDNDKAFEKKLLNIIQTEFPLEKQTYVDCVNSKNHKLTAEIVHKLKHKISILGLEKSYETAVAFEHNLLEGNFTLQNEFEAILTIITNYLKKL